MGYCGTRRVGAKALAAGAFGAAVVVTGAVAPAGAEGKSEVPVVGQGWISATGEAGQPRVKVLVHGVRRISGGTALYFSVGMPPGAEPVDYNDLIDETGWARDGFYGGVTSRQYLVDMTGRMVYGGLISAERRGIASPIEAWQVEPGRFHVLFQVFPELPADTREVSVVVGQGAVISGIPVEQGALEPAVPQENPLPLGGSWPQIDESAVASAESPETARVPLELQTSDLDKAVVEREITDELTVDLSADVLFAVDSATLTPAATRKVGRAVKTLNERAAGGTVKVVGHTDDTGSDEYNDDLSRRRAETVAKVLRQQVTVSGLSFTVEGRGEREPVESNDTAEGRKANRRVSVIFDVKEKQ